MYFRKLSFDIVTFFNFKRVSDSMRKPNFINTKTKIFTPLDPRWDEFTDSLCFHLSIRECEDCGGPVTNCDGSFKLTYNIIESHYPEINIQKTLDYFRTMNCFCDCEIFFEQPCGLGCAPREGLKVDNR